MRNFSKSDGTNVAATFRVCPEEIQDCEITLDFNRSLRRLKPAATTSPFKKGGKRGICILGVLSGSVCKIKLNVY